MAHLEPGDPWLGALPDPRHARQDERGDRRLCRSSSPTASSGRSTCGARARQPARSELAEEAQLIRRFATLAALAYANAQRRELLREQALHRRR